MKRISLFLYIIFLALCACEKDETMMTLNATATPPKITSVPNGFSAVIKPEELSNKIDFAWSKTDYGVSSEVTYSLQVDAKCNNFANPVVLATSNTNALSLAWDAINGKLLNDLKLAPNLPAILQLRIVSTLNNSNISISEPVDITIKPWSDKPFALWVGESSASAPVLFASQHNVYEGYRSITAPVSVRFANSPVCADTIYGKTDTGKIQKGSDGKVSIETGYYKFKVDANNDTYEIIPVTTWGMIGTATPGNWTTSSPLTYNSSSGLWEALIALKSGVLKFRANDGWDINYGPANSSDMVGTLVQTDAAITIDEPGTYKVTLDFTQSKAPYKYAYKVEKSADVPEPVKIYLPGGYQGGDPAAENIYTLYTVTGESDVYEGYVKFETGTWLKFTRVPNWGGTNYGFGDATKLSTSGTASPIDVPVAGHYRIKADLKNLTYEISKIDTWGLIGTSTDGGWDTSTPMNYDAVKKVWTITQNLKNGALKFRANNGWGINYGTYDISSLNNRLKFDAAAIDIPAAGNYTITLDFSRSKSPYEFTYTIIKN
jgi:hypothetical protein